MRSITGFGLAAVALALTLPPLTASAADFYKGKTMRFIIRTPPGGDYDSYSRLFARHMGKHIPGNPGIRPENMTGGGGIIAANYIALVGPRDGTILSIISQGLPIDQALKINKSLKADLRTFNWIGNIVDSNQLLVVWHTAKTKTLDQAKQRETTIGSTGAGSVSVQLPTFYNRILGTKFKIIAGYRGGQAVDLAMEKGEVEGRGTNPLSGYKTSKPHYLRDKLIIPLIQVGLKKEPELPDVPLLLDQPVPARDKPLLEFMSNAVAVGRSVATSPGVPVDRVEILRKAFLDTIRDPAFMADAKKMSAVIRESNGPDTAALINRIIDAPQEVRDRMAEVLKPGADLLVRGKKRK
jgi:tripartite-type tricarboxylate transporter receptor subunit TctC